MLEKGDRFLVVKYSNKVCDCIARHREVLEREGYCWFGKIGVAPSISALQLKLNQNKRLLVLYCQGKAYLCDLLEYSLKKPKEGYPDYYNDLLFGNLIFPSIYFKLGSIQPLPIMELSDCVSFNTDHNLLGAISRSMASFFYGVYPDSSFSTNAPRKIQETKKEQPEVKISHFDKNSCVYKENGICKKRGFVSYGYECERPSSCIKQKVVESE